MPPDDASTVDRVARESAAIAELARRALALDDLLAVMEHGVEVAAQVLDAEHASLLELSADGRELRLRAGVGWQEGVIGARVDRMPGGYVAFTVDATGPVVVENLAAETRFAPSPLLLAHGVISSVAVQLPGEGERPFGVLGVHTSRQREFSVDEIDFLRGVAGVLSVAIARSRQALELNDTVLQAALVARYALEVGQLDEARRALDETIARTRRLVSSMLATGRDEHGRSVPLPGDLRRARPAELSDEHRLSA